MTHCKIGIVGLGVMGHSLALNIAGKGFPVAVYDLDAAKTESLQALAAAGHVTAAASMEALAKMLEGPRQILMMVPAGSPVDGVITQLRPFLERGDILIDGGNSFFADTERRNEALQAAGIHYIGAGVSGGQHGALHGPGIMPGGQREAWEAVAPIFRSIAARAEDGQPCVEYLGPRGAGHYVKMAHNGIEYGDMQLIAETYDILHRCLGLSPAELQNIFADWNTGFLKSYLIEITADIFGATDPESGVPLVDVILDDAQQKGTGKWTSQNAMEIGAATPTINAAVESRLLSALKPQRVSASMILQGPYQHYKGNRQKLIDGARDALYASKVTSYAQGFSLLKTASDEYRYGLRLEDIAKIWRAGCIISAALLNDIMAAYQLNPNLVNLLLDDAFRLAVESRQNAWRFTVQTAVGRGIPVPAMSSSLAYFDAYRSSRLPANLTQAQRDYFGAHTYRRIDKEGVHHTEWQQETIV